MARYTRCTFCGVRLNEQLLVPTPEGDMCGRCYTRKFPAQENEDWKVYLEMEGKENEKS